LAIDRTPPIGNRPLLSDGRAEKRSRANLPVYVARTKEPRAAERIFTRNVSPHGARVVTTQLWHSGDEQMLTPLTGEAPRMARVVYCQPRPAGGYYVGLCFPDRSVRWEEGPRK
jgi:hypothetical protein